MSTILISFDISKLGNVEPGLELFLKRALYSTLLYLWLYIDVFDIHQLYAFLGFLLLFMHVRKHMKA